MNLNDGMDYIHCIFWGTLFRLWKTDTLSFCLNYWDLLILCVYVFVDKCLQVSTCVWMPENSCCCYSSWFFCSSRWMSCPSWFSEIGNSPFSGVHQPELPGWLMNLSNAGATSACHHPGHGFMGLNSGLPVCRQALYQPSYLPALLF